VRIIACRLALFWGKGQREREREGQREGERVRKRERSAVFPWERDVV